MTARSKADASWLAYAVYAHPGARLTLEGFEGLQDSGRLGRQGGDARLVAEIQTDSATAAVIA